MPTSHNGYLTWNTEKEKAHALATTSQALQKFRVVGSNIFYDVAPNNVSVRDGFSRTDYDYFRPGEASAYTKSNIVHDCNEAYYKCGIVKNMLDTMSEFATQSLRLVHPIPAVQRFHRKWFKLVRGLDRSERIINLAYRTGSTIVNRQTAKLPVEQEKSMRAVGADVPFVELPEPEMRDIPVRYTIINPESVRLSVSGIATFLGEEQFQYEVMVPSQLVVLVTKEKRTPSENELVKNLPGWLKEAIRRGDRYIKLPMDRTSVVHHKRDDWKEWGTSLLEAVLPDIKRYKKMQLADQAALDGAISSIRVWKLGSLEHRIVPGEADLARLAEMLTNNVGGGVMDMVWGPDIELTETSTAVHQFLGSAKYEEVLGAIYGGMGIPAAISGKGDTQGFTNNFFGLKTLIERLQYGRNLIVDFWEKELKILQKAMGFPKPARIVFDKLLTDEGAQQQLIIHLVDRDIITPETAQELLGFLPEIEKGRMKRHMRERSQGKSPPKASPFHNPQLQEQIKDKFAQSGGYAPSEMGIDLLPKGDDKSPKEIEADLTPKPAPVARPKGQPGQGRPQGSKDKQKRKQKSVQPRRSASAELIVLQQEGEQKLKAIDEIVAPLALAQFGRKNKRALTNQEAAQLEDIKFNILCRFGQGEPITEKAVLHAMNNYRPIQPEVRQIVKSALRKMEGDITLEMEQSVRAFAWAYCL